MSDETMKLGKCCACGGSENVWTIIMHDFTVPGALGKGWGCVVCALPANGALSVLCDACLLSELEPREIVLGYAKNNERLPLPVASERTPFLHDLRRHDDATAIQWLPYTLDDSDRSCVCSVCGQQISDHTMITLFDFDKHRSARLHLDCHDYALQRGCI